MGPGEARGDGRHQGTVVLPWGERHQLSEMEKRFAAVV